MGSTWFYFDVRHRYDEFFVFFGQRREWLSGLIINLVQCLQLRSKAHPIRIFRVNIDYLLFLSLVVDVDFSLRYDRVLLHVLIVDMMMQA